MLRRRRVYRFSVRAILASVVICAVLSSVLGSWLEQIHQDRLREREVIQEIEMLRGAVAMYDSYAGIATPVIPIRYRDDFRRVKAITLPLRNPHKTHYSREMLILLRRFDHLEEIIVVGSFSDDAYRDSHCLNVALIKKELPGIQIGGSLH